MIDKAWATSDNSHMQSGISRCVEHPRLPAPEPLERLTVNYGTCKPNHSMGGMAVPKFKGDLGEDVKRTLKSSWTRDYTVQTLKEARERHSK